MGRGGFGARGESEGGGRLEEVEGARAMNWQSKLLWSARSNLSRIRSDRERPPSGKKKRVKFSFLLARKYSLAGPERIDTHLTAVVETSVFNSRTRIGDAVKTWVNNGSFCPKDKSTSEHKNGSGWVHPESKIFLQQLHSITCMCVCGVTELSRSASLSFRAPTRSRPPSQRGSSRT